MLPVSVSPEALKVKVVSTAWPPRPGTCAVHFPLTSAARATKLRARNRVAVEINLLIVMAKTLCLVEMLHVSQVQPLDQAPETGMLADRIVARIYFQQIKPESPLLPGSTEPFEDAIPL